jgi:hypothetical protein
MSQASIDIIVKFLTIAAKSTSVSTWLKTRHCAGMIDRSTLNGVLVGIARAGYGPKGCDKPKHSTIDQQQ